MAQALEAGARFGTYTVVRLLGTGGMGAVYEARHEGLHKRVAIKTMHAEVAHNAEAVERFVREGRTASMLRHPHVVDVTDVGVQDGTPYLVMEYLDGRSLADVIEGDGALPIMLAVDVLLPVVDALAVAHDAGVVHRDLKPDNIFLVRARTGGHHPKLLDFGISKVDSKQDGRLTKTSSMMGTPYYMSPEQARGAKNVDGRCDQFSLGLVLWEMLTGRRAIEGDSLLEILHRVSTVDVPPVATLRPDVPEGLAAVVARMIHADAAQRFASMRAVGTALVPFASPPGRATWKPVFESFAATGTGHSEAPLPLRPVARAAATPAAPGAKSTLGDSVRDLPPRAATRSPAGWIVASAVVLVVGVGGAGLWLATSHAAPEVPLAAAGAAATHGATSAPLDTAPQTYVAHVRTTPTTAYLSLDGVAAGTGELRRSLPRDGTRHAIEARADGYQLARVDFVDEPPAELIELVPLPVPTPPATVIAPSEHAGRVHAHGHVAESVAVVATHVDPPPHVDPPAHVEPPAGPAHGANGSPLIR